MSRAGIADALRKYVDDLRPDADPAAQLVVAQTITTLSDALVDALAREWIERGASYAAVGRAVGISREAARLRYWRRKT